MIQLFHEMHRSYNAYTESNDIDLCEVTVAQELVAGEGVFYGYARIGEMGSKYFFWKKKEDFENRKPADVVVEVDIIIRKVTKA